MPDIVGIGAVNLDYIVAAPNSKTPAQTLDALGRFDHGSERGITAGEAKALLADLEPLNPVASPGGSALNTIASIASIQAGVSVGYVGICGLEATGGFSFPGWFDSLSINTEHLKLVDGLAGTCVSLTEAGQRSLLTTQGANAGIMAYLAENTEALVDYLSTAKVVLITSFANLGNVHALVSLVRRLRAAAPDVIICCDPGAMWTIEPVPDGVDELLSLANWLLMNEQEFERSGQSDRAPVDTVLVKRPDRVQVIAESTTGTVLEIHHNPKVLSAEEIIDDTGTGDAFAAGLLLALASKDRSTADGIQLGMRLAAEKLRWPGLAGLHNYAAIAKMTG